MYVKKKKAASRKTVKDTKLKRKTISKGGFIDPFESFKVIEKMTGF